MYKILIRCLRDFTGWLQPPNGLAFICGQRREDFEGRAVFQALRKCVRIDPRDIDLAGAY